MTNATVAIAKLSAPLLLVFKSPSQSANSCNIPGENSRLAYEK